MKAEVEIGRKFEFRKSALLAGKSATCWPRKQVPGYAIGGDLLHSGFGLPSDFGFRSSDLVCFAYLFSTGSRALAGAGGGRREGKPRSRGQV